MGKRKGRGKPRKTKRRPMDMDNGGQFTVGVGVDRAGENSGEKGLTTEQLKKQKK